MTVVGDRDGHVEPDEVERLASVVRETMEGALPLSVPLVVDVKVGDNWESMTPLTREDVEGVYAGLRPLLAGESESTSKLSREHVVAHTAPGLVVVAGGKYTTYRVMAKDAIDAAAAASECAAYLIQTRKEKAQARSVVACPA